MKICTKCKIYTPDKMMVQGGLSSWCKICAAEYVSRFRATDRGKAYKIYSNMLSRCYNIDSVRYEKYGAAGIIVDEEWLGESGFDRFFAWYSLQENAGNINYQLDKDIYCNANNIKPHIYSSETCKFVSRSENQRNYSDLLKNNTSGYTGVTINKNKTTWDFRLHRSKNGNINRFGFKSALEAAKARETCIIVNNLDFKLEHVGTTMLLSERPNDFLFFYESSNYNCIRRAKGRFTGIVNLSDKRRKSIGAHASERQAAEKRNEMIDTLGVSSINTKSYLFGFDTIQKEN